MFSINLRAPLICAQEFACMRVAAGGDGAFVNVTSIAGHRGFQDHMCYAASKAGLEGATRVMARELGPHGIRVNAVAPTITLTELAAAAWSDPAKSGPMMVRHPVGRFGRSRMWPRPSPCSCPTTAPWSRAPSCPSMAASCPSDPHPSQRNQSFPNVSKARSPPSLAAHRASASPPPRRCCAKGRPWFSWTATRPR